MAGGAARNGGVAALRAGEVVCLELVVRSGCWCGDGEEACVDDCGVEEADANGKHTHNCSNPVARGPCPGHNKN